MRVKNAVALCIAMLVLALSPAAAKELSLDSVCADLTAYKVTSGSFVQQRFAPHIKRPLTSGGSFVICDMGIAWKTDRPFSSLLAVSRDKIIQTAPDGKKTVIDGSGNPTFKNIAGTLATLFSGDKTALEESFYTSFSSDDADNGEWAVVLVPKDSTIASALKKIILEGTSGEESFINAVSIEEQNDARIVYSFSEQMHKNALSDDEKAYFSAR